MTQLTVTAALAVTEALDNLKPTIVAEAVFLFIDTKIMLGLEWNAMAPEEKFEFKNQMSAMIDEIMKG